MTEECNVYTQWCGFTELQSLLVYTLLMGYNIKQWGLPVESAMQRERHSSNIRGILNTI